MVKSSPNYKKIYSDILENRYPEKKEACLPLLNKDKLSFFDIIKLNSLIFGEEPSSEVKLNPRFRSYNKDTIFQILEYQKKYRYNNTQLSCKFGLSRNTISKWRKMYQI